MDRDELERLVGGRLRLTFDEILNHPRLPEARRAYLESFVHLYEGDPFLVRLLLEAGRFLRLLRGRCSRPRRRSIETRDSVHSGMPLKRQLAMYGYASDRQVDHLVARLREVGFLEQCRAPGDGRMSATVATDKLRTHHTEWLATHYIPLAVLFPDHDYGPVLSRDRSFHVLHCSACFPFNPASARLLMTLPDTLLFFTHAAGPLIQNAVLKAAMDAADPNAAIPYIDAADRFGVSRTHVRNLMGDAEAAGLVRITGRGGHSILILPRFWASYDRGLAVGMYLHDAVNLVATAPVGQGRHADGEHGCPVRSRNDRSA